MFKFYHSLESQGVLDKIFMKVSSERGSSIWRSDLSENNEENDSESEYYHEMNQDEENNQSEEDDDLEDDLDAYSDGLGTRKRQKKNKAGLYKYINNRISKFYFVNEPNELIYDMDTDACEEMSDDEWQEDNSKLLIEDHKKKSDKKQQKIHQKVMIMNELYFQMTNCIAQNLKEV